MARIRTIKPEFPQSESMGRVSRDARLTFVLLWTLADDAGRLRGNSRMLASLLFPYDDDAPTLIDKWLAELSKERCITRYLADGGAYVQIDKWLDHQKIDRPSESKIPSPNEASITLANNREDSSLDQRTKDQGSEDQGSKERARAPDEPKGASSGKPKRTDIATFEPDDEDRRYALDRGRDPSRILETIRAWAANCEPESKRFKRDPRQFWQNWCRNAAERGECGLGGPRRDRNGPAGVLAAARSLMSEVPTEPGIRPSGSRPGEAA